MLEFLAVGIGGFIGSCLRFGFTKLLGRWAETFPFATLLSNVIAALMIGFIIGFEQQSCTMNQRTKLFLTTGLLGGLSTFCTFSLETVTFFQNQKYLLALGNIALNVCLSLLGVVIGMFCAKLIFKKA